MNFEAFKEKYQKVPVEHYPHNVKEEPVVSVCVQTYQHADYIEDCLEGILMQEIDFLFEILLGEDASEDGTREICIEYAEKYPDKIRLFLHDRENNIELAGQPSGRFNFLYNLFVAKGKYIALCEGDDYWTDPLKLQKQVEFMEENPDVVLTYHKHKNVDASGKLIDYREKPLPCTLMFINDFSDMPPMNDCPNGDRFLLTYFSLKGSFEYLEDISPSVRRHHEGGVMSMVPMEEKVDRQVKTWSAVYDAFKDTRIGKKLYFKKTFFIYKQLLWHWKNGDETLLKVILYPLKVKNLKLYKHLIRNIINSD